MISSRRNVIRVWSLPWRWRWRWRGPAVRFSRCYDDPIGVNAVSLHPALRDVAPGRVAQKAEFGCEFFPNVVEAGSGRYLVDFFQTDRDGRPKGSIVIDLEDFEQ